MPANASLSGTSLPTICLLDKNVVRAVFEARIRVQQANMSVLHRASACGARRMCWRVSLGSSRERAPEGAGAKKCFGIPICALSLGLRNQVAMPLSQQTHYIARLVNNYGE